MKSLIILALLGITATSVYAGIVVTESCGGVGTFNQLLVDGCEGEVCELINGTDYEFLANFNIYMNHTSVCLNVRADVDGERVDLINTNLGAVVEGVTYQLNWRITPGASLIGNEVLIISELRRCQTGLLEFCRILRTRAG